MPYSGDLVSGRRTAVLATVLVGAVALGVAAQEPPPKLLPGGNPCGYPPAARKQEVAGTVRFVARVTPEGVPESVEIQSVPKPDLGFEEAVRDCVSQWRFEPAAPGQTAARPYMGRVRFRIAKNDELGVRARLEELAAAWNAANKKTLEDLAAHDDDFTGWQQPEEGFLFGHIKAVAGSDKCRIELEEDVSYFKFYGRDVAFVGQSFSCLPWQGAGAAKPMPRPLLLTVARGPRGWRFALMSEIRVGGSIREPRRLKEVRSDYPVVAQQARVQGIVTLGCHVSAEGRVVGVEVFRRLPLIDEAAVRAVRQWEFEPTMVDGVAVPTTVTVQFDFKLDPPRVDHRALLQK